MCSIGDEPPPLVDPTKKRPRTPSQIGQKIKAPGFAQKTKTGGYDDVVEERAEDELKQDEFEDQEFYDEDAEFLWDEDEFEDEYDEDEYEDEEGDEEEDEDEDEDEEEQDEEEDSDFIDEDCDLETPKLCTVKPSDIVFQESDLEDRKKRRYTMGVHSFLDLNDPRLDQALEPAEEEVEEDPCGATEYSTGEERTKKTLRQEKQHYKDLCNQLGIKPEPKFLANLRNPIMDLSFLGMNSKEVIAICKVLETNVHVQWLSLAGNAAGRDGGMAIAELIQKNKTINTYILSGTEILEAFEAICDAIAQNSTIINLNFSKNDLEDMDMPGVRKILRGLSPLQVLNLNANLIRDDGLKSIGQGLFDNKTMEDLDLSHNKFLGDKKTTVFFNACAEHPEIKFITLRRNFIRDEGGKAIGRALYKNPKIEELDVSFNLLGDATAAAIGRGINRRKLNLKKILIEFQRFREKQAALILKPMGNAQLELPIELVDFGMMLDIHKEFIKARDKALRTYPALKILHGQVYGLEHGAGPDHKQLVIRRADAVCKSFETPLVMLMEELAKEKPVLTPKEFKKFIKQCNLYKDKTLTEAFEKVFDSKDGGIDGDAILDAFDKEYPGLRKIPEPVDDEEEEMEEKPKKEKKKKGKGKGKGKGKKGKEGGEEGAAATKKGGKGKKKKK